MKGKNTQTDTWLRHSPEVKELVQRYYGDEAMPDSYRSISLSKGIELLYAEVYLPPVSDVPEEAAFFNFFPLDGDNYYVNLTYIPETQSQDGHHKLYRVLFQPSFFQQFPTDILNRRQPFRFDRSVEQAFNFCAVSREALSVLFDTHRDEKDLFFLLQRQSSALSLLRRSLEAFIEPDESNHLPACSFLAANAERDKVLEAQKALLNSLDKPLTIRELSRIVGMNECYLKKGFKAMFGKTIHEYQQHERIEHAKNLLSSGAVSVNEVAFKLGFSSPSHFSSVFKKVTGMKPCELIG